MYSQQRHLVAKCVTTLVRLISGQMYHPGRDILGSSILLLWSGWPLVRCTPTETTCGQVCYYFGQMYPPQLGFGSGWHLVRFLVRLTSVRCTPWQRQLVAKCVTTLVRLISGQMYPPGRDILWPSVLLLLSGWPLVRCTPWQRYLVAKCVTTCVRLISGQMYPLAEKSCGQVCNYFCQVNLWLDVPPGRHLVAKCVTTSVRLTSG